MGTLARFDIAELRRHHRLHHFVETGTGRGDSLAQAARLPFKSLWSCEMEHTLCRHAVARFAGDPRVGVVALRSTVFIDWLCTRHLPAGQPVLFWLDAHFPGADYGLHDYAAEPDPDVRLPLRQEIAAIVAGRPRGQDVVLIDDLRLFLDGPFRHGNLPANVREALPAGFRQMEHPWNSLLLTHTVSMLYEDEGYVVLTPKPGLEEPSDAV